MNVVNMLATALHMTPFARGLGGGGEGGEREFPPGLSSVLNHYNSVCPVYISKVTGVNPLTGLISVRQEGAYAPPPPTVLPHKESLAAQAAEALRLLPGYRQRKGFSLSIENTVIYRASLDRGLRFTIYDFLYSRYRGRPQGSETHMKRLAGLW